MRVSSRWGRIAPLAMNVRVSTHPGVQSATRDQIEGEQGGTMAAPGDQTDTPTAPDVQYGTLILAGMGAGGVVFGLGSRIAMRLVGIAASPEHLGQATAFGVVGTVTLNGVVQLVFAGSIAGLFTGLLYLAIRPWLPGGWGTRGLAMGLILLSPIGIFIVASSKADFDLASSGFILSLFAGMILLEGLATAWAIERLGRGSLPAPHPRAIGYAVLGTAAALGFVALGASVGDVV